MEKYQKRLILFMPSMDGGGVEKNIIIIGIFTPNYRIISSTSRESQTLRQPANSGKVVALKRGDVAFPATIRAFHIDVGSRFINQELKQCQRKRNKRNYQSQNRK